MPGVDGEVMQEQLDRSRSVSLPAVRREHVVADVDGSRLEPLTIDVVVHPADDLALDHDAPSRPGVLAPLPEETVEDLITPRDQDLRLARLRGPDHDEAVGRRSKNEHP